MMADDVTPHNAEELALCIRFTDEKLNICEEFLHFAELKRTSGYFIAEKIRHIIQALNIFWKICEFRDMMVCCNAEQASCR